MKFVILWEFDPEDLDKVIEKSMKFFKELDGSEGYPKIVSGPFSLGGSFEGFTIHEVDKSEQIANFVAFMTPELNIK